MSSIQPVYRHLTDDGLVGDGTNHRANVNGAVTPVPFWYGPTTGITAVHRMIVMIEDTGALAADNYGSLAGLSNGLHVRIMEGHPTTGTVVLNLADADPIHSHADWAAHCYDVVDHSYGSGSNFIIARWTFSNSGRPLILNSFRNEKLVVTVRDDLTGLVSHQFQIQGHKFVDAGDEFNTLWA